MKISVTIATYNGANYLEEQLESLMNQTMLPDEIIISDDNSSDSTPVIINNFKKGVSLNVKFVLNDRNNRGYTHNFINALKYVTGDLIFLSDQDDVWFPEKIETIYSEAIISSKLLFMHDADYTNHLLEKIGLTTLQKFALTKKNPEEFVSGSVMAFKKELLDMAVSIPPNFVGHDNWIAGIAQALDSVKIVNVSLMYYRRHEGATMVHYNAVKSIFENVNSQQKSMDLIYLNFKCLLEMVSIMKSNSQYLNNSSLINYENKLKIEFEPYKIRFEFLSKSLFQKINLLCLFRKMPYKGKIGFFVLLFDLFGYKNKR